MLNYDTERQVALMQGLLSHAEAFSPSLHELMSSVTKTTRTIERILDNLSWSALNEFKHTSVPN